MPNNPYYVFDGKLCKAEGLTKEQIYNAIAEATGTTPTSVDEGFISTLVETNRSRSIHVWKGTQAEYNALESHDSNTFYIIDDDSTIDDIQAEIDNIQADLTAVEQALVESDWIPITKVNLESEEETIGFYKTIGKNVFVRFNFGATNFVSDDSLQIILPENILINTGISSASIYFSCFSDGVTPVSIRVRTGYLTSGDVTYVTFQTIDGSNLGHIQAAFSWITR